MANEQMARQFQTQQSAVALVESSVATDVQEGISKALTTRNPNPFAMTFEGEVNGKKVVSPYVKKAGRSVLLNEVAKKKGGIALMRSTCVRASWETKEELLEILSALSADMKRAFMESRGNDFRSLSLPPKHSLYRYVIIFKSGEKWEGEGIAHTGNIRATQLHNRIDEMAETRAFMRCVGRGIADGFISPEQAAGSADIDLAEQELLAEEQGIEGDVIDTTEAGPEVGESFPSPDGRGAGGTDQGQSGQGSAQAVHSAEAGPGAVDEDEPFPTGKQAGDRSDGADSAADAGTPIAEVTIEALTTLAKEKRIYLLPEVKSWYGVTTLKGLTAEQRADAYNRLQAM